MQLGPEVSYWAMREVSRMGLLVLSSLCLAGRRYIADTVADVWYERIIALITALILRIAWELNPHCKIRWSQPAKRE